MKTNATTQTRAPGVAYQITARREVPTEIKHRGLITGKRVTEIPNHAGQKAVHVRLADGSRRTAWGFGATWEAAEIQAAEKAAKVPT